MLRKLALFSLFFCSSYLFAEQTKTIFNPFTGKFDYITRLSTTSIAPGSGVTVTTTSAGVEITATGGGGGAAPGTPEGSLQYRNSTGTFSGIANATYSATAGAIFISTNFYISGVSSTTHTNVSTLTFSNVGIDFSTASLYDGRLNVYTSSAIPYPVYSLQDTLAPTASPGEIGDLSSYVASQSNNAVTGGVGISGVAYVPELDRLYLVDNNALAAHVLRAGDLSVRIASITLSGFGDPEGMEYMFCNRDSDGKINSLTFAVSEEQLNQIVIFSVTPSTQPQVVTKATSLIIQPTGLWTLDATEGMESITYNPFKRVFYVAKQNTNFEFRVVPYDGNITPAATEPFDAEAKWGATMPAINDLTFDQETRTCIAIGDLISSSTNDQDILRFDCETGDIIEHWDNYIDDAGLTTGAGWVQSEGVAYYHGNLWVSSEANEVALLKKGSSGGGAFTSSGGEATQTTANDILTLRDSTDGDNVSFKMIQDIGAADISGDEVNCWQFERYDNNELEATQNNPQRGRMCSETPVGSSGVPQESGAQIRIDTTLGSATHGLSFPVTNMRLFNTGHVTVSSVNADLGGRFQVVGSSDETQAIIKGHTTQNTPLLNVMTSGGSSVFNVSVSSISFFGVAVSSQSTAIPNASGGATVDAEARNAINALLQSMRRWGFVQ